MSQTRKGYFSRLIESIDIFKEPITLFIKGQREFATVTGGCFSFLFIVLIVYEIVNQTLGLVNYRNSSVIASQTYAVSPSSIPLNLSNFAFTLGIYINNEPMTLSNSYFSIEIISKILDQNEEIVQVPVSISNCNLAQLENYEALFAPYNIESMICPNETNYEVSGSSSQGINLYLKPCVNGPGVTCASQSEINYIFDTALINVTIYFVNHFINPLNIETPIQTFLDVNTGYISPSLLTKYENLYFDLIGVNTSGGPTFDTDSKISFNVNPQLRTVQYTKYLNTESYPYYSFSFWRSPYTNITIRQYGTIFGMLSSIGGLSKSLFFLVGIIVTSYSRQKYHIHVSNLLYDFRSKTKGKQDPQNYNTNTRPVTVEMTSSTATGNLTVFSLTNINKLSTEDAANYIGEFFSQRIAPKLTKRRIKMNFFDFLRLKIGCCPKNPKIKTLSKASELAVENVDILEVLKKLKEIDKLKKILLTEDQLRVFNYTQRPIISETEEYNEDSMLIPPQDEYIYDQKKDFIFDQIQEFDKVERYIYLYKSYLSCLINTDNPKNSKLLELLGPDIINAFEDIRRRIGDKFDKEKFVRLIETCLMTYKVEE